MGFDDLPRQCESDAAATALGGVEGHEEVGVVGNAGAVVLDADDDLAGIHLPSHLPANCRT